MFHFAFSFTIAIALLLVLGLGQVHRSDRPDDTAAPVAVEEALPTR